MPPHQGVRGYPRREAGQARSEVFLRPIEGPGLPNSPLAAEPELSRSPGKKKGSRVSFPGWNGDRSRPIARISPATVQGFGEVAKLVDASDLKSEGRKVVGVRLPSSLPAGSDQLERRTPTAVG